VRLEDTARVYTLGYMLEPIRVRFKKSIRLDTLVKLEAREDESRALPRWLAKILSTYGMVDVQEPDMGIELLRALSREKVSGSNIAMLEPNFYIRVKDFIDDMKRREVRKDMSVDRLMVTLQDIILLRLDKMINHAKSSYAMQEVEQRLSIEERLLLKSMHASIEEFKAYLMGSNNSNNND
jgi:hypothetical protein